MNKTTDRVLYRQLVAGTITAVFAINLLAGCSSKSDSDRSPTTTVQISDVTEPSTTVTSEEGAGNDSPSGGGQETGSDDGISNTANQSSDELTARFPELNDLTTMIDADKEIEACNEAQRRIRTYRELAERMDLADIPVIADSLEEFEQILYGTADEQDWGDRMIEPLTNVRRIWITANGMQDEPSAANAKFEESFDYFDKALAVDCPT